MTKKNTETENDKTTKNERKNWQLCTRRIKQHDGADIFQWHAGDHLYDENNWGDSKYNKSVNGKHRC